MHGERVWKQALQRGYLSVQNDVVGQMLLARYRTWCLQNGWPYVTVLKKRETATVEVDMRACAYSLRLRLAQLSTLYMGAAYVSSIRVHHRPFIRVSEQYILCTNIPLNRIPELVAKTLTILQEIKQLCDEAARHDMSHMTPFPPFVTSGE